MTAETTPAQRAAIALAVQTRLREVPHALGPEWGLWEKKNLNIHRGVIHWSLAEAPRAASDIREPVRRVVTEVFRPRWWRGFGFGVVLTIGALPDRFPDVAELIDVRNNRHGTWQWIVLVFPQQKAAVGVQTWTEGYLAPVYHDLLRSLRDDGFECMALQKDMDAFMRTLLQFAKYGRLVSELGTFIR